MKRRDFLKTLAALGGVLAARPLSSIASQELGGLTGSGAARTSRLPASSGLIVVHTDLHNHSLISGDALGNPGRALAELRDRGIDVACMTEHAISGKGHGEITCPGHQQGGCQTVEGINDTDWQTMAYIADAAYEPGAFVSFRGFEWSPGTIGHLNVWFSSQFTDALWQRAFVSPKAASEADRLIPPLAPIVDPLAAAPDFPATIEPFYEWLDTAPGAPVFGGGSDGVACFNHPNDFGTFEEWKYHAGAAAHVKQFEAFNTNGYVGDFFWSNASKGMPNPFNACLNAGWRVGFTGVSDEHSGVYQGPGHARGGLWVTALTRAAVHEALDSRRSFGTMEPGLRLDATANGEPMGTAFAHSSGSITIVLDVDRGPDWAGAKELWVQVVRPGSSAPVLAYEELITVPGPSDPLPSITLDVNRSEGDWLFVRIVDRARPKHPEAPNGNAFEAHGGAIAYASPWFLDPA